MSPLGYGNSYQGDFEFVLLFSKYEKIRGSLNFFLSENEG